MVVEQVVMPNHVHLILALNDIQKIANGIGLMGDGTMNGNRMIHDDASKIATQFGKPVSGSVPVIINQYKAPVKRWCNKNGYEFFQWPIIPNNWRMINFT